MLLTQVSIIILSICSPTIDQCYRSRTHELARLRDHEVCRPRAENRACFGRVICSAGADEKLNGAVNGLSVLLAEKEREGEGS